MIASDLISSATNRNRNVEIVIGGTSVASIRLGSKSCPYPWLRKPQIQAVPRRPSYKSDHSLAQWMSPIPLLFLPKSIGRTSLPYKPAVQEAQLWARALTTNTAEHQYLRYCLMSIKCLFLETHEPSSRQVNHPWAYQHQITASRMFRNAPSTIDESNWVPVLIFTISMLIFQFASQQASKDAFDYLETLRVLKMSSGVASSVGPFLVRSEMWAFITRRNQLALRPADPNIWIAVQHLENCITLTSCRNSVLMDAVQALKEWIELCDGSPRNWKQYCLFPGMISEEYLMLLTDEDDAALLIMIYWCSIMRLGPKRWFFDRWLTRASAMAQAKLTGDWPDVLEWSNKIVSVGVDEEFTDKVNEYRKSEECMMFF
jgi:hypothetical protein